jgi:TPR repeat protein
MEYNERLMNEALHGNDDSFEELKYNAGAGDCEAQYFLAMYYAKISGHLHDSDYHYWLEKSKANGYVPGVGKPQMNNDDDGMSMEFKMEHLNWASHIATLLSMI